MNDIPKFGFFGPVNPGKTSVIATLLEEDGLRISKVPGETTECQKFELNGPDGVPILEFYDTPGFQNPEEALSKLRALQNGKGRPIDVFQKFLDQFGSDDAFSEERKLLGPIMQGAGIIYVVDASTRVTQSSKAEMEFLRLTGQPVLGLINWTGEPVYKEEWQNALHLHFRTWEFNAHKASYLERIELLNTLMALKQAWAPALRGAISVFEESWINRTRESASIISEMLIQCLEHKEQAPFDEDEPSERDQQRLVSSYKVGIEKFEAQAHARILSVFKHRHLRVESRDAQILANDLFSDVVWEALGMNETQLVVASTIAGGIAGLGFDVLLGGHSLGLAALTGAILFGGTAIWKGKKLPQIEVNIPGRFGSIVGGTKLGSQQMVVGPLKAVNFPWVMMDRAMAVFNYAVTRAHARQDREPLDPDAMIGTLSASQLLTVNWPEDVRGKCVNVFASIVAGKATSEHREDLARAIENQLRKTTTTSAQNILDS